MNITDRLIERTIKTRNPSVIGLDPDIFKIPDCYKQVKAGHPFEAVANAITAMNQDVIDVIAPLVPAVKPQMAFYENTVPGAYQLLKKPLLLQSRKAL